MNDQTTTEAIETPVPQPIDDWNDKFRALMNEAQAQALFAPDVLLILQRATIEIQAHINSLLFTHEHKTNQEEGE